MMINKTSARAAVLALPLFAIAAPALAQSNPSAVSAIHGNTTGLSQSHRFTTRAAATAHCPGDTIVWSAGKNLHYRLPDTQGYGAHGGFYACKMEADGAGFTPGG